MNVSLKLKKQNVITYFCDNSIWRTYKLKKKNGFRLGTTPEILDGFSLFHWRCRRNKENE